MRVKNKIAFLIFRGFYISMKTGHGQGKEAAPISTSVPKNISSAIDALAAASGQSRGAWARQVLIAAAKANLKFELSATYSNLPFLGAFPSSSLVSEDQGKGKHQPQNAPAALTDDGGAGKLVDLGKHSSIYPSKSSKRQHK